VDADFQQLVKKGKKSQQDVESMIQLANEVQYSILTRRLQPGEEIFMGSRISSSLSSVLQ
jgi:SPX domain protein involved in polyphosphate accumulation